VIAVALGLGGIAIAWVLYGAKTTEVPRNAQLQALLEHKFYFDELYDAAFYRPAVFLAKALGRWVERPLVFGSIRELSEGVRGLGLETRRLQTGIVRTYAFAIAASLAVVTIVFVAVR